MIRFYFLLLFIVLLSSGYGQGAYHATSGEFIFSFSDAAYKTDNIANLPNGNVNGSITNGMRFTLWFHLNYFFHYDFNKTLGFYTGIGNRNIGFYSKEKSTDVTVTDNVEWKRRSYALSVPLALKIGNLEKDFYVFGGGFIEMMYHYKEKEFLSTGKRKYTEWFSPRTNRFVPSVFVGVTFPRGLTLRFTYFMDNLMNPDYVVTDNAGIATTPYKYMSSKIFYFSFYQVIKINKETYKKVTNEKTQIAGRL